MGQYIEYIYYGGHQRLYKAGTCRIEDNPPPPPTTTTTSDSTVVPWYKKIFRRNSQVIPKKENGTVDGDGDGDGDGTGGNGDIENNSVSTGDNNNADEKANEEMEMADDVSALNENAPDEVFPVEDNDGERVATADQDRVSTADDNSLHSEGSSVIVMPQIGGYLTRMKAAEEAAIAEAKLQAKLEQERLEANVTDWVEWKCIVCNKENRRSRHPKVDFFVAFREKGMFYKRTIAALIRNRDVPICSHCLTPSDYVPRLCTAHTFPYNPNPHVAFENYPEHVPSLPRSRLQRFVDKTNSCLFGQRNHPDSKSMPNDWRLSMYLSSRFPAVPRPRLQKGELYEIDEVVECRIHKLDWSRARVTVHRPSHIYDIRYDTGDELRMVEEHLLRLPSAKGLYAYRTELRFCFIVLFFPLAVAASIMLSTPGMVCCQGYLLVDT